MVFWNSVNAFVGGKGWKSRDCARPTVQRSSTFTARRTHKKNVYQEKSLVASKSCSSWKFPNNTDSNSRIQISLLRNSIEQISVFR